MWRPSSLSSERLPAGGDEAGAIAAEPITAAIAAAAATARWLWPPVRRLICRRPRSCGHGAEVRGAEEKKIRGGQLGRTASLPDLVGGEARLADSGDDTGDAWSQTWTQRGEEAVMLSGDVLACDSTDADAQATGLLAESTHTDASDRVGDPVRHDAMPYHERHDALRDMVAAAEVEGLVAAATRAAGGVSGAMVPQRKLKVGVATPVIKGLAPAGRERL